MEAVLVRWGLYSCIYPKWDWQVRVWSRNTQQPIWFCIRGNRIPIFIPRYAPKYWIFDRSERANYERFSATLDGNYHIPFFVDHLRLSRHIYVDIGYHTDALKQTWHRYNKIRWYHHHSRFNVITCPRWGTSIVRMHEEAPAELSIKRALPLIVIRSYTDSYKLYSHASNTFPLW